MSDPDKKCFCVRLVLAGRIWADTEAQALEQAKDIGTNLECIDWDIKEARP